MTQLIEIPRAKQAIQEAQTVEETLKIRAFLGAKFQEYKSIYQSISKIDTAQNHNREIKDSLFLLGELRLLNEAKLGELLKQTVQHGGDRRSESFQSQPKPTLKDWGITKYESSRAQQLYENKELIPEVVEKARGKGEPPTLQAFERALQEREREKTHDLPQPEPVEGKYRVIYADPPWKYGNKGLDDYGHAERHYPTLTIEQLCSLGVKDITEEDAVLFLWVTSPMLEDAFQVIKAWGFEYKASFVWDKVKHNFGHYNSVRHELLLVCTKGSCVPDAKELIDSVQVIERTQEHSEKPERFREIISALYTRGNKIELFARREAQGWYTWGNQL